MSEFGEGIKDFMKTKDSNGKKKGFDELIAIIEDAVMVKIGNMIITMAKSVKPIVTVVRGSAVGIGFTMLSHTHFVYCAPDAKFNTPFMKSA